MPVRSPLSSVTPALSMATSVPVPMAMPTSAAASAGASLTPSPAIATTRPSLPQALDDLALVLGQDLGLDLVDAEAPRHRLRGRAVVAGQHDDADAFALERGDRVRGVVALIGSAMAIDAGGLPSIGDEDAVAPSRRSALGLGGERRRRRCRARPGRRRCRSATWRPLDNAGRRPCRSALSKSADLGEREPRFSRAAATMARAERMLAAALEARREAQQLVLVECRRRPRSPSASAGPRSACRSCRRPACRPSPCARAPRRS